MKNKGLIGPWGREDEIRNDPLPALPDTLYRSSLHQVPIRGLPGEWVGSPGECSGGWRLVIVLEVPLKIVS